MRSSKTAVFVVFFALLLSIGGMQETLSKDGKDATDKLIEESGIDPMRVSDAISKGVHWLKQQKLAPYDVNKHTIREHELVLYTLLHAGVSPDDETFRKLLKEILTLKLDKTYTVSLQAMVLQELDAEKYQWRIAQCGQFLVDNQCKNGQWSYGEETEQVVQTPPETPEDVATGTEKDAKRSPPKRRSTRAKKVIRIMPQREGPETGDNSNSQYAALGIRACMEANVMIPGETVARALKWWEETQRSNGGWGYGESDSPWGSMTAGAVASVVIYRHLLRQDFRGARSVNKGIAWMAENFTVEENPGNEKKAHWLYYYLYAIERVGMLAGINRIGSHKWYAEGAEFLLKTQETNGSWPRKAVKRGYTGQTIWDTCFAILFLKMATAPVETGSRR